MLINRGIAPLSSSVFTATVVIIMWPKSDDKKHTLFFPTEVTDLDLTVRQNMFLNILYHVMFTPRARQLHAQERGYCVKIDTLTKQTNM
jgi:hypothetical protein